MLPHFVDYRLAHAVRNLGEGRGHIRSPQAFGLIGRPLRILSKSARAEFLPLHIIAPLARTQKMERDLQEVIESYDIPRGDWRCRIGG